MRFNAFSRLLRAGYHDTLYPSIDGKAQRTTFRPDQPSGDDSYEIHEYTGALKICPSSGLTFDNNVLLKNTTDLYMRERVPNYRLVYDAAARHVPSLISLRHGAEPNYWHYLQLVATKAVIADLHGVDPNVPVLLSRRQYDVPFIKRSMDLGLVGDRPIVLQEDDEVISTDQLYSVRPPLHGRRYRDLALKRLGQSGGDAVENDRIFVTRGRAAENNRMLQNEAEVVEALSAFGFRTVDPQTLSFDEQMTTFSRCGFMISPHGAGLTNMIFRRGAPLEIIEIFNFNLINPCYEIVAGQYDFGYRALYCRNVVGKPKSGNAIVDVDELVRSVESMLSKTSASSEGPKTVASSEGPRANASREGMD